MALSPHVVSRDKLIDYIKQELGYPVIAIEVTNDQIENQINKALEEYIEIAEGGVQYRFSTLTTTSGTLDYSLNYDVQAVVKVFDGLNSSNGWVSVFPDKFQSDMYGSHVTAGDLISVEFTRHYMDTIEHLFNINPRFDFNTMTSVLHLYKDPGTTETMGYVYYQKMDHTTKTNIYDNIWIKDFSSALTRQQWGRNLSKYSGTMLPGGITQNADSILSEAKEDIERLRLDLREKFSLPAMFFVG